MDEVDKVNIRLGALELKIEKQQGGKDVV